MPDPITRLNAALASRYRIERELGAGGMATVYLADDLKHDRKVAIKVLKPELAAVVGSDRFLSEIRTTANLQHPHILPLFDSGEADSFLFYVMPYVEGESLRERLDREGELPVDEAVGIATAVGHAIDYAHRHGVIHRDIKPANILLHDGQPLVADFGIALAVSAAGGGRLTETGLSLGTPYYMSPEQATAERDPDPRSDVYALGCVVYEMLVGEPPYTGTSAQAVLGKILTTDPVQPTEHRRSIPEHVDAVVLKALEKRPADRFGSAAEFVDALRNQQFKSGAVLQFARTSRARDLLTAGFALAFLGSVAVAFAGWRRPVYPSPPMYDVGVPDSAPIRLYTSESFSVPADGSFIVYEAATSPTQLWRRDLSSGEAAPIPGTEDAHGPIVSPDGQRLLFQQDGKMHTSAIDGLGRIALSEFDVAMGHYWLPDGRLAVMDRDGTFLRLYDSERQIRVDTVAYCIQPEPLPDGRLLCAGGGDQFGYVVDPRRRQKETDSEVSQLIEGAGEDGLLRGADLSIVDERYLVFVSREGDLRATTIDLETFTAGRSVLVVPGVRHEGYSGLGHYQITSAGTLFFIPGADASVGRLVEKMDDEDPKPLPLGPERFLRFSLSPDGTRLATVVEGIDQQELRTYDVGAGWKDLGVWHRAFWIGQPAWRADGTRLLFESFPGPYQPGNLMVGSPGDATPPETLPIKISFDFGFWPTHYVSDTLIVGHGKYLNTLDITKDPPEMDTLTTETTWFPVTSPDTRWIALGTAGDYTIRILPFPSLDREFPITESGLDSRWLSQDELVFMGWPVPDFDPVDIDSATGRPVGDPQLWFSDPRFSETPGPSYTLGPGGSVIYLQSIGAATASYIRVIPNWVEQMKRAVDEANR